MRPELDKAVLKGGNKEVAKRRVNYCYKYNDSGKCDAGEKCRFEHVCRWCFKKGHVGKDCYSRREKKNPGSPKRK